MKTIMLKLTMTVIAMAMLFISSGCTTIHHGWKMETDNHTVKYMSEEEVGDSSTKKCYAAKPACRTLPRIGIPGPWLDCVDRSLPIPCG